MRIKKLKSRYRFLVTCMMIITIISIIPEYIASKGMEQKGARLISGLKLDADVNEVDSGDLVTFTATFLDTLSTPEPVIITVSDGGILLAEQESDIDFRADGVKKDVSAFVMNEERSQMTFRTGAPAARKISTIIFQAEAPIESNSFQVRIQIGTGVKTAERTIDVRTGLTIHAPAEVDNDDSFYITGDVYLKSKPSDNSFVRAEIINKATGESLLGVDYRADVIGQSYSIGPIVLPTSHKSIIYTVKVSLIHNDNMIFEQASIEIKHFSDTVQVDILRGSSLALSDRIRPYNFLWVANSSKGTVVKINTDTGEIIGEFRTSPTGQPGNPKKVSVDKDGSVWVANSDGNSIVKIGLKENGQWIDKNGNGVCDSSIGLNDIKAWSNTGGKDTNGGITTAEDECILFYIRTSSSDIRHLSVDKNNNLWVSGISNRLFQLIDGRTGSVLRTEGPVGFGGGSGLMDRKGILWSANPLLRWDTNKKLSGINGVNWTGVVGTDSSSLGIDMEGNVWASTDGGDGKIRKYSSDGTLIGAYEQGSVHSGGIVVDMNDNLWVSHSHLSNTVGHIKKDGTYLGSILVSAGMGGPTGIAVDGMGFIWVVVSDGTVVKIDPMQGAIGADGRTRVGAVVFVTQSIGEVYSYGDMTGSTLVGLPDIGTFEFICDSKQDNTRWQKISWLANSNESNAVEIYVSSSSDGNNFSIPVRAENNFKLNNVNGRYLKIIVRLNRLESGLSPQVNDITVYSK